MSKKKLWNFLFQIGNEQKSLAEQTRNCQNDIVASTFFYNIQQSNKILTKFALFILFQTDCLYCQNLSSYQFFL